MNEDIVSESRVMNKVTHVGETELIKSTLTKESNNVTNDDELPEVIVMNKSSNLVGKELVSAPLTNKSNNDLNYEKN